MYIKLKKSIGAQHEQVFMIPQKEGQPNTNFRKISTLPKVMKLLNTSSP